MGHHLGHTHTPSGPPPPLAMEARCPHHSMDRLCNRRTGRTMTDRATLPEGQTHGLSPEPPCWSQQQPTQMLVWVMGRPLEDDWGWRMAGLGSSGWNDTGVRKGAWSRCVWREVPLCHQARCSSVSWMASGWRENEAAANLPGAHSISLLQTIPPLLRFFQPLCPRWVLEPLGLCPVFVIAVCLRFSCPFPFNFILPLVCSHKCPPVCQITCPPLIFVSENSIVIFTRLH